MIRHKHDLDRCTGRVLSALEQGSITAEEGREIVMFLGALRKRFHKG
ncbi:MAG: hypothetical protein HQL68_03695 [Magnetococcales bacterium]|nr:hypothetical protein [Magnetococcales bacterium]